MAKKLNVVSSVIAPLVLDDIDTDQIIPAQAMTSTSRTGYGASLFKTLRVNTDHFILDQAEFKSAEILLVGENFGCGSSREHAVWALAEGGIKAIIGKSFADIFRENCSKNGLLLITLDEEDHRQLHDKVTNSRIPVTINLPEQTISGDGIDLKFQIEAFNKHCLINGFDYLDYLVNDLPLIREHRRKQKSFLNTKKNWSKSA